MDYEQKYREALERARQFSEHPLQEDSANIVEYLFPELKESERMTSATWTASRLWSWRRRKSEGNPNAAA